MVNITHKNNTLRKAIATAVVQVSSEQTIDAVLNNKVPKGNVFEMSKTAGLFAAKKTSDVIPDCHPLPIEFTAITFDVRGLEIHVFTRKSIPFIKREWRLRLCIRLLWWPLRCMIC